MSATDPNLPHDSKVDQILGVCSAMLVITTVVVAARIWTRLKLAKGGLGSDDWCIIVAWVLAIAFDLDPINQVKFGLGQHIYDLPENTNFSASLELYCFGEIIYFICVAVTKIAILILYLRLATSKVLRSLIWGVMAFVALTSLSCVVATIFQCTPISKAWEQPVTDKGSCIQINALFYANAGLDIFQDLVIYILPMRMLYSIQIPRRQKYVLMIVFAVGGFVVVTGMIRLYYLQGAQASQDPSYDNVGGAVWSSIECNIGVVCASLPHFKPLFDRFFPSLMGRSAGASNHNGHSGPELRKNHVKQNNEYELENGGVKKKMWKDTYEGKYRKDLVNKIEGGDTIYWGNDSEESLRGVTPPETEGNNGGGIYKSTRIVVSRLPAER
ncbi:uncharacterized protein EAF01_011484 [Botrytis porri]|uniref:Rhodopsin domain-containing protein n=1 Tax=Botrytis porri TaxID=87229 RepID=A0A4Z1KQW4_9HELO|nr:uncharacterized protein EAF01_011484 [Botrytis porri]KAF7884061.1 hypothetical protein EAF01_011484 [Botrytis porri]TGO84049.1 hypothetical protein BPOR_0557g00110 [Botrytis porri]